MLYPILINVTMVINNQEVIGSALIDLHPSKIARVVNTIDGFVLIKYHDGDYVKTLVSFSEFLELYKKVQGIDMTFEDTVKDYLKDNFKTFPEDNGETDRDIIRAD